MGRKFLILVAEIFAVLSVGFFSHAEIFAQQDQILLPDEPKVIAPPPRKREWQLEQDIERKRQEHLDKKMEEPPTPPPSAESIKKEELFNEAIKPRPFQFMLSTFLTYPFVFTQAPRENYVTEPSGLVEMQYRLFSAREINETQPWIGFRGAFFNGSGTVDDVGGRFSFLYFGPTIGLGKYGLAPKSLPKDADKDSEALLTRSGWMLLSGIAAQSRTVKLSKGDEPPAEDLNSKGIAFDSPGVWGEFIYTRIHWGAVATHYLMGTQLGKGKIFVYIGFGVGGIY